MKSNLIKAIAQDIYGFGLSWLVLEALGVRQSFKIAAVLFLVFIPGWAGFNWLWGWGSKNLRWPRRSRFAVYRVKKR